MPFGGLLTVGLITAGIGAGTSLYENSKAAGAAQDATDKSLALQKQMYDTTRADLSPYSQTGVAALGNLRQLTGLPANIAPTPSNPPPGGIPVSSTPGGAPGQMQVGTPQNPGPSLRTPQGGLPPMQGQSPAQMQTSSGYVTMRSPTGETQQVDAAHVPFYQQKGATVIS